MPLAFFFAYFKLNTNVYFKQTVLSLDGRTLLTFAPSSVPRPTYYVTTSDAGY